MYSLENLVTMWILFYSLSVWRRIQLAENSLSQGKHHRWTDVMYPTTCCQRFVTILLASYCFSLLLTYIFQVLTQEWYNGVLARIRINAFRIELAGGYEDLLSAAAACVEAEAAIGNAVYMLPSFYNHDCGQYTLISAYMFASLLSFHFFPVISFFLSISF